MSTGAILPPQELTVVRAVAKSAAVLFTLLMIERRYGIRAVSDAELSFMLQVDVRTVQRQLSYLSAASLVTEQAGRWVLTPAGRGTLFGENAQDTSCSIEGSEVLYLEAKNVAQNVLLEEDRGINTFNVLDSSSIRSDDTKCARVKQILQAAAELFGAEISAHEAILSREPDYVLGWVCKAWNDYSRAGSTLRSPASLIYRRLMDLSPLPVLYQKNPMRGLPAEFLRGIGLDDDAQKAEAMDAEAEPKVVRYSDGAFREFMNTDEQDDRAEINRNEHWLNVLRDERFPSVKGIAFTGLEKVDFEGNLMQVFLRAIKERRSWREDAVRANEQVAPTASKIYAAQTGNPSARVVFAMEVV